MRGGGDFILECIIQLEGGVKKRSAVKSPRCGMLARWACRIREGRKEWMEEEMK